MKTTSLIVGFALGGAVLAAPLRDVNEKDTLAIPPDPSSPWFRAWDEGKGPIARAESGPEILTKITLPYRPVGSSPLAEDEVQAKREASEPKRPWRSAWNVEAGGDSLTQREAEPKAERSPFAWTFNWSGAPGKRNAEAKAERNPFLWTFDWSGAPHKRDPAIPPKTPWNKPWSQERSTQE